MIQVTITARRIAPSVTGAGAGVVRSVCHPWSSWCAIVVHVSTSGAEGGGRRLERVHDVHDEREQPGAHGDRGRPAAVAPERTHHVGEQRGADHRQHEPAAVEHAHERQRGAAPSAARVMGARRRAREAIERLLLH